MKVGGVIGRVCVLGVARKLGHPVHEHMHAEARRIERTSEWFSCEVNASHGDIISLRSFKNGCYGAGEARALRLDISQ